MGMHRNKVMTQKDRIMVLRRKECQKLRLGDCLLQLWCLLVIFSLKGPNFPKTVSLFQKSTCIQKSVFATGVAVSELFMKQVRVELTNRTLVLIDTREFPGTNSMNMLIFPLALQHARCKYWWSGVTQVCASSVLLVSVVVRIGTRNDYSEKILSPLGAYHLHYILVSQIFHQLDFHFLRCANLGQAFEKRHLAFQVCEFTIWAACSSSWSLSSET